MTTLRYCTVEQALQDLANFIRQMNVKYKYSKPKWVTFGGSYAGTLNAWFRRKYPHMTVGAVASSAPLTHYLDYFGYSKIMEKVIRDTSASCHNQVGGAIQVILSKTFTAKGRNELSEKLRLAPAFNETTLTVKDIHHLMASIYDLFQSIVQYSYDGKIRAMFDWMYAFDQNMPLLPDSTLPNSYQDIIEPLKNTTFDDENGNERAISAAWRAWIWISCNQLGLMQTTSSGRNIFGSMLPLKYGIKHEFLISAKIPFSGTKNSSFRSAFSKWIFSYYIDACVDIFGDTLSITTIRDNNLALRSNYGDATDYTVANIVLPNGSLDPFRLLGTYADYPVIHQKTMLIDGSSHCADMYPQWSGEPPALASARAEIQKELEYFIESDFRHVGARPDKI
ncbi:unnamed protein product [Anisakis simplex]|uniref:Serine protease K12H4.7 n=1 Tax=Anisakis simplex TaxID=6269 RepID=A0A0M3K9W9_ANISI|nr:unnamed protein product [Anisakis simplex]